MIVIAAVPQAFAGWFGHGDPRACDLVKLRVRDVCHGDRVAARAMVPQQKTQRPVQFEDIPANP